MGKLRVLDLFSGIGGFSLGLKRTGGFETVAFCEIDHFAESVLKKHWPTIPNIGNIEEVQFPHADIITAGFPCQDISLAGPGEGLAGLRSGLWREALRAVCVVRPIYAILENVAALLSRGMGRVLGDLAEIGYDSEWDCIPASYLGACHKRDRVWVTAYPIGTNVEGLDLQKPIGAHSEEPYGRQSARAIDAAIPADGYARMRGDYDGVPQIMGELRALGNSVYPAIPELIGNAILASIAKNTCQQAGSEVSTAHAPMMAGSGA
jgi:DNA (cytosine-5)-methyltransferase 1